MTQNLKGLSVSHATHRPEDLIPAFMVFLANNCPESYAKASVSLNEGLRSINLVNQDPDTDFEVIISEWNDRFHEHVQYFIEELFDLIEALAPEGYYFGAHPGDGSDFGFWELEN